MKKNFFVVIAIVAIFATTLFASASASTVVNGPSHRISKSTSSNWSGYAVPSTVGSVTNVQGSWIVPAVTPGAKNTYSAFWVGIDGYESNSVEQIGTDSNTNNKGQPYYDAWYEMYPAYPVYIAKPVYPGDYMTGEVSYANGAFTLSLIDAGTNNQYGDQSDWTFVITITGTAGLQRSSAEWIAEAPSSGGRILPLANFGTVTFTDCSATISGKTGPIDTWASNDAITMASGSGRHLTIKAVPSALDSKTDGFSVTWKHQ